MKQHTIPFSSILSLLFVLIFSIGLPGGLRAEQLKGDEISRPSIEQEGSAKIQFNELAYDFGKVFQNKSLEHLFSFKNIGTSTLQIEKVKAG